MMLRRFASAASAQTSLAPRLVVRPTCISNLLQSCHAPGLSRAITSSSSALLNPERYGVGVSRLCPSLRTAGVGKLRPLREPTGRRPFFSANHSSQNPQGPGTSNTGGRSRSAGTGGGSTGGTADQETLRERNMRIAMYATAVAIGILGLSYAAVPLYQIFCQATGYGGTTQQADEEKFKTMKPVPGAKPITVNFNADTSDSMPWTFVPQQRTVKVVPGETALAFYTAHNPSDAAVTGVSTYNVTPMRAGLYFHKIQCFCFEEQRLRPHEEIDMPIFFYIDPAILDDPVLHNLRSLTLSYTFFRTGEAEVLDIENEYQKREAAAAAARSRLAAIKSGGEAAAGAAVDTSALTETAAPVAGSAPAAAAAGSIASMVNSQPRPAGAAAAGAGSAARAAAAGSEGVGSARSQEALRVWSEALAAREAARAADASKAAKASA